MADWKKNVINICCYCKGLYLILFVLSLSLLLVYMDKSYTLIPTYISNVYSDNEESYIETYDELISNNKTRKTILLWTTFFKSMWWKHEIKRELSFCSSDCEVTDDRSQIKNVDAILFHHGDLNRQDMPSPRWLHQPWVLFTLEPTTHIQGNLNWWNRLFNWTMSYRTYSTIFNPYGYYMNNTRNKSSMETAPFKERSEDMFGVISRCHDDARRYKLIHTLKGHFKVDIYGRCSSNKLKCNSPSGSYCISPEKIKKYKFKLSFENGHCRDYITEKYWDALGQNVVPIVNWKEYQNNHNVIPHSYINIFDFNDVQSAMDFIKEVSSNETLYNTYHEWKALYTPKTTIFTGFCRLCSKLHRPFHAQVYRRLENWFKDDSCNKYNLYDGAKRHIDRYLFDKLQG